MRKPPSLTDAQNHPVYTKDDFVAVPRCRSLEAERDSALREIVGTDLTFDVIARHYPDAVLAKFPRQVADDHHVVLEFHSEGTPW